MADYSFLAGLGSGLSELGSQLTRRQLEKQAKEERDAERKRQKEKDALERGVTVLNERKALESMNYDANAPEMVHPSAINGMGGQEDAMKRLLETHDGDQYISPIDGTRYTRAQGQRPNEVKQAHEAAMKALSVQAAKDLDAVKGERDMYKFLNVSGNTAANNAGGLQRVQIQVDGQRDNNANSVGSANSRAAEALADKQSARRDAFINDRTREQYDSMTQSWVPARMSYEEAAAEWGMREGKGGASPGAKPPVGGEQALMARAQQKIAEIQADASLDSATKASMIQQVNQLLTAKIQALRSGR